MLALLTISVLPLLHKPGRCGNGCGDLWEGRGPFGSGATKITATVPAGSGKIAVTVTTPLGTSAGNHDFTYTS